MLSADLRNMRTYVELTQADLATLAGTSRNAVAYWENRRGPIGGWAVERFLAVLIDQVGLEIPDDGHFPAYVPAPSPICGARTRSGTPCRCIPVKGKRRCKLHGGKSTGPRSIEGRERIAAAQRARWASMGS